MDVQNAFLHGISKLVSQVLFIHCQHWVQLVESRLFLICEGNDEAAICDLKHFLNTYFKIKDLGPLKYFLGVVVARSRSGITICQRKYTLDLLEEAGLLGAKPAKFPMEQTLKLNPMDGDLPRRPHLNAVLCLICYLKNAPGQGLLFPTHSSLKLMAYCDTDWAGC
ncbi:uncharacterized protein LOC111406838 [Olea europaea var. sylvestris]|uniref:uncharacterized protein LOC111406838 n=1 Tax=Olea europaea var. sylvestris TaxID=158386 RepID=UPI000C1D6224|nr:uncharacterized protein LOC111406838 [Olea europaea var. sylvestris]